MEKAVRCPGGPLKHPLRTFTSEAPSLQREEIISHLARQAGRRVTGGRPNNQAEFKLPTAESPVLWKHSVL